MTLDTHAAIRARRTVHDYAPLPVDELIVQRALDAAHLAPCHKLTWPWRFTRVGPRTRDHLVALTLVLKGITQPEPEARLRAKMQNPALLFVVSQVLAADPVRRDEDHAACACAIQNFLLSLAADGVGSKWGTGAATTHPDAYAMLGVDPEIERILGFLWVGMPAREHRAPERPPRDRVVRDVP